MAQLTLLATAALCLTSALGLHLESVAPLSALGLHLESVAPLSALQRRETNIFPVVKSSSAASPLSCTIGPGNPCDLSSYNAGDVVDILPGGDTACMESSSPYEFRVIKGSSEKLVFYFQGGGLCFSEESYLGGYCRPYIIRDLGEGFTDTSSPTNPYADHTIVVVNICTGDFHSGQATPGYLDSTGNPVKQFGFNNVMSVLNWVVRQQKQRGGLKKLDSLVIAGSSAGAAVIFLWAKPIFDRLNYDPAAVAVISDSAVNTWPSPFIVYLMHLFNVCSNSVLFSPAESGMCTIGTIDMYTIQYQRIADLSNAGVEYAIVTSSEDFVQTLFTNAVLASVGSPAITAAQNFGLMKQVFQVLNQIQNFVVYIKNGVDHMQLPTPAFYLDEQGATGGTIVAQWVGQLPLTKGSSISSVCPSPLCDGSGIIPKISDGSKAGKGGKAGKSGKRRQLRPRTGI
jgi:hypothetical protein